MNNGKCKADQSENDENNHHFHEEVQQKQMQRQLSDALQEMSGHVQRRREIESIRGMDDLWKIVDGPLLKPRERDALKLKMLEDLSHNEIADRLQCSERTAQRLYEKAIRKLADAILY